MLNYTVMSNLPCGGFKLYSSLS